MVTQSETRQFAAIEPFVDAEKVGVHLGFKAGTVVRMAHRGDLPAVPFRSGKKTYFRFKLSEIDAWAIKSQQSSTPQNGSFHL